jgi:hypothetical protein
LKSTAHSAVRQLLAAPRFQPVGLLLGIAVFLVHCHGNMGCSDSIWSIPTAVSLIDHGDTNLDEYQSLQQLRRTGSIERYRDHDYTVFPIGTSLLAVPGVIVLRQLSTTVFAAYPRLRRTLERSQGERGCRPLPGEPVVELSSYAELIIASAIVAITTVLIYQLASLELAPWPAALVALAFAFGTSAWSTASRALWQHGPSMLMLAAALLLQRRGRWLPIVGAMLAFAYIIRPTNLIPMVVNGAWAAYRYRSKATGFFVGVAAVVVPFVLANHGTYGTWLPPYYQAGRLGIGTLAQALVGNLVSPGRGLLVYSPFLLFSFMGIELKLRDGRFEPLDAALLASIVLHWILVSLFPHWWGGYSYGPRFLSDMLPYLSYFLIPAVGWLFQARDHERAVTAVVFGITLSVSVFIHAEGAFSRKAMFWNAFPASVDEHPERLWDWRHPPFLAALDP